ncbi:hypothetical protein SASPL_148426 [Salvia splendens]|uniref:PGG domain-containing protein n=1 Tax=Salvia splendens TaxID=180675 RepID=A0A8X8Z3D2_SALSN|nr:hypothetical protein SASPL_148426 [Salvia splendens]
MQPYRTFRLQTNTKQTICKQAIIAAAESGNNDVVEEIVRTLPVAIHTRNYLNQNFLHVAVKNRCYIQIRNGEAAEMIFTREHRELKIEGEKWMKDTANSCTITAALIATVVFAAAITVPGGNQSESGYPMLYKSSAFTIFAISDAVSLFTSCYVEQDFLYALPKRLCIGLLTLFLSFLFMMVAFSPTLYLVFGQKKAWILLLVGALTCLPISSFVLLQFQLLRDVISTTFGRRIFGKQSDRPFH